MKVWWCEEHEMVQLTESFACDRGYEVAEVELCRMVEKYLLDEGTFIRAIPVPPGQEPFYVEDWMTKS